ncbi:MAG TPA: hypothetical protein VFX61_07585 [Micromonosporaceae bacterium]|nr:hypothetical protein [Micromonosporaceae bacterium]
MNATREQEIVRYVNRVGEALADLPPAVRDELLEDLPEHLAEVAAEGSGSLVDRLGAPEVYATELRAAAGASAPVRTPNLDDRISAAVVKARGRLQVLDTKLGPIIGYAALSEFLRLLRPAWWVLRGYLAAMVITLFLDGPPRSLLPQVDHSRVAGLLLLAVTVIGSIWLGRRSGGFSRWPRMAVNAGSALAVLFGVALLLNPVPYVNEYAPISHDPYSEIQDVYVYDEQGRLLENVRLFDQNGQSIRLGHPWCDEAYARAMTAEARSAYPYCPQGAPFRLGSPSPSPEAALPEAAPSPEPTAHESPSEPTTSPTDSGSPSPTG